ncbi:MAG: ABC transporter permease subunit [Streptosporangiales bacterium]|nr:ABC transporter permease subunit [Streptosporangiales bacterium]
MTDTASRGPTGGPSAVPEPEAVKAIPVRNYGRWVAAVLAVGLFAVVVTAFGRSDQITWEAVPSLLTRDTILLGAGYTLLISVTAMVLGIVLGVVAAVMRLSPNPVTSSIAAFYVWFFRGTPVLVQLLLWYNLSLAFPTLTIPGIYSADMNAVMTPFVAALLGLGINEGAYMAEIVRAGILSIDPGQVDAANALGMDGRLTMRRIVLPQAMRVIIPPTGNEYINMLKTSSLASVVQFPELLKAHDNIAAGSLAVFEGLMAISIWYLVLTTVFSIGQHFLERRFARGTDRRRTLIERLLANIAPKRVGAQTR